MSAREEWRPIPGLPYYEASNLGRIRSSQSGSHVILRGWLSGSGYRYVKIRQDGRPKDRTVHSLVAEAFYGPRPEGMEVRHLDGTRLNNAADNLRWGTASENRYDSVRHGTHRMVARRLRNEGRAA
jgi:hypothetical protein